MIRIQCPQCGVKLKAPDSAAGKKTTCPKCSTSISIPEPIYDAEALPEPHAEPPPPSDIYDLDSDPYGLAEAPGTALPPRGAGKGAIGGDEGGENRRPCPMCGEMILATAAKCRFCGEVFDPGLKKVDKKVKKKKRRRDHDDEELTTGDWLLCIFCGGIGCILGIIYMIQGKPKGGKMVGLSIAFNVLWGLVRVAIEQAARQ